MIPPLKLPPCPRCHGSQTAEHDPEDLRQLVAVCVLCGERTELAMQTTTRPTNGAERPREAPVARWEWWDPARANVRVAISKGGQIRLPLTVFELLGKPTHVRLGVDQVRRAIGLQPSSGDVRGAAKVTATDRQVFISGKAFLDYYSLLPSKSVAAKARLEDGVLVVALGGQEG